MRRWLPAFVCLVPILVWCFAPPPPSAADALERHRNLGKAFYENPTTQKEAVAEFAKALALAPESARDRLNYGLALLRAGSTPEGTAELEKVQKQDPSIPHTWFNLAIVWKKAGETERAIAQMEQFVALVPDEPISQYNLGALYKAAGQTDKALPRFVRAAELDPSLAAPHFQLYNAYRTSGRPEEAKRELATFQSIRKQQEGAAIPEDIEWNAWAEVLDVMQDRAPADLPALKPVFATRRLPGKATGGLFLDVLNDGHIRALTWSDTTIALEGGPAVATLSGITAVVPGDYNNDGLPDLCVLTSAGPVLLTNRGAGRFARATAASLPGEAFAAAVWLDYDHDYDLDLFLFGARSVVLRNAGSAGFEDRTADFPFIQKPAVAAVAVRSVPDTKSFDLAVSYSGAPGVLYSDQLQGRYKTNPLPLPPDATRLSAADLDGDGGLDLLFTSGGLLRRLPNRTGTFGTPVDIAAAPSAVVADLDNRGVTAPVTACPAVDAADRNEDGLVDLLCVEGGTASILTNRTPATGRNFLRVRLAGVRNGKSAPMAEVEVKAGSRYQKRVYTGAPLTFGLGAETVADTVRITWPNGLIQNEIRQAAGKGYRYEEAQRLSGSCPMVWTWDGNEFRYITDVLGVAPLGASTGDGGYFPVDDEENIVIPGDALRPRADGLLEVRITEELSEVAYLDRIRLLAVDHPRASTTLVNEKFQSPPFPPLEIYDARSRIEPVRAVDHAGRNVLPEVLRRDRTYPTGFRRDLNGVAEPHHLDVDFGNTPATGRQLLVLHGWVDWADGSTFLAAAQEGKGGLQPPSLQVRDSAGKWVTVIEDMGMPAGKPKTIAVDLTGKWRSDRREVRIVTNLCVYWDEVWLSTNVGRPTRIVEVPLHSASLGFRGFSPNKVHPQRLQPEEFQYAGVTPFGLWNPTPGFYTRYGDVTSLARTDDNLLIVMGSGDEARLLFDPGELPPVTPDVTRDYVISVAGWAKDRDANTAFSQNTEPLPFRGMSGYPYGKNEQFPDTPATRAWRREYQNRPALRLQRPLYIDSRGRSTRTTTAE